MPYHIFFNNTIIVQDRYIIIETKEFDHIGYNGFLFPHKYSGEGRTPSPEYLCGKRNPLGRARPSPEYLCEKRNPLYPIRAASFVSIVLYPIHNTFL